MQIKSANIGLQDTLLILLSKWSLKIQSFNLIGDLTVHENVELPLTYQKMPKNERKERVHAALEKVSMAHRMKHYPSQLAELKEFFKNKHPEVMAFGGSYKALTKKTAKMLKEDLKKAKIPYIKDGETLDFHALRHTFITNLRFAPSRYIAQSLARHRSSAMTDRYMHIELQDERAALESMPDISPADEKRKEAVW